MLRISPPNVGDERQPAPRHPNGSQRSSAMVPRQGNTDTATWCVLGSSAHLGEAPQASPLQRLSAFSHRAISFHENSARDRGMSRGPRTVVSFACAFGGRSASGPERAMRPPRRGVTVPAAPAPRASITPPGRLVPARGARRRKRPPAAPSEAACELSGWGRSGRKDGAPRPHPLRGSAPAALPLSLPPLSLIWSPPSQAVFCQSRSTFTVAWHTDFAICSIFFFFFELFANTRV